jgi:phosphoglycolate phosphatase-like HAD superfamily hydrolase
MGKKMTNSYQLLKKAKLVFWDFDGVIKDSLDVKANAFQDLFSCFGLEVALKVKQHHEKNGGISRFEKIPLYLSWTNEQVTTQRVDEFYRLFSEYVYQAVIESPWVPGVREYLSEWSKVQHFVLVSATPQEELDRISIAIGIKKYFHDIHGSPLSKAGIINSKLAKMNCPSPYALMIGDSETDLEAAAANDIPFLLRSTKFNKSLREVYSVPTFEDLTHE